MAKKKANSKPVAKFGDVSENSQDPERIYMAISRTLNLGNYESLRVEYGEGIAASTDPRERLKQKEKLCETVITNVELLLSEAERSLTDGS